MAATAWSYIDGRCLDPRLVQHAPCRRFIDWRGHPNIFPGHMQRVINRIFSMHDRFDLDAWIHVNPAHQAVEFAERPLRVNPTFG